MTLVYTTFGSETGTSTGNPRIGNDTLQGFLSSEPRLASHRFYVNELLRRERTP